MRGTIFGRFRAFQGLASRVAREGHAALAPFGDAASWSQRQWEDFWGDWRGQAVPRIAGGQMLSVVPASFFNTPDWASFANELKGIQEVVRWTLYSYKVYPAAGTVNLLFFDQSEGTAVAGRLDTNMTAPGTLPGNEMQVVVGVSFEGIPAQADVFAVNAANGLAAQQWYNVYTQGWLEVKISGKEYFVIAPLTQIPPGHGFGSIFSVSALAANVMNMGHLGNGTPDNKARYNIDPPLGILPTRPFEARLRYNAVQAVATAGRCGVNFDGWKVRAVL